MCVCFVSKTTSSSLLILLYFKLEFVVVAQWFTINRVIVRFCSVVSDILCSNFIKSYDEFSFVSVLWWRISKLDVSGLTYGKVSYKKWEMTQWMKFTAIKVLIAAFFCCSVVCKIFCYKSGQDGYKTSKYYWILFIG